MKIYIMTQSYNLKHLLICVMARGEIDDIETILGIRRVRLC